MNDIMVDVETTGTNPDRSAVIQIAAVRFDLSTGAVDGNFFNECLMIPPWRHWDFDTQQWWMKQKRDVLQGIYERMRPTNDVLNQFVDWVGYQDKPRMWAKAA